MKISALYMTLFLSTVLLLGCSVQPKDETQMTEDQQQEMSTETDPTTSEETTDTLTTDESADTRILLTPENIAEYNNPENPNVEEFQGPYLPAVTVERYENTEKGYAFDVPYNPAWGSERFRIPLVWDNGTSVEFGTIGIFEGGMWVRSHYMDILPKRSSEEAVATIEAGRGDFLPRPVTVEQVGDLEVVSYTENGLCSTPHMEVIGTNANYLFRPLCGSDADIERDELRGIIATFVEL